jgi:hypothetical protein
MNNVLWPSLVFPFIFAVLISFFSVCYKRPLALVGPIGFGLFMCWTNIFLQFVLSPDIPPTYVFVGISSSMGIFLSQTFPIRFIAKPKSLVDLHSTQGVSPPQSHYLLLGRSSILLYILLYSFSLIFLVFNYGLSIDKINFSLAAGGFQIIIFGLSFLAPCFFLLCIKQHAYRASFVIFLYSGFLGVISGSKGFILPFILVFMWYLRSREISPGTWLRVIALLCFLTVFSLSFSYGGFLNADYSQMLSRVAFTFDGIIALASDYKYPELQQGVLYHFFQFFTFKIFQPVPGVGQMLASISPISYSENGGPNDSLHAYFILGGFFDKFIVVFFSFFASYLAGLADTVISSPKFKFSSLSSFLFFVLFSLNYPGLLASTGTTFLLVARASVVLLILFFLSKLLSVPIFQYSSRT